jgi:hypothetical protein
MQTGSQPKKGTKMDKKNRPDSDRDSPEDSDIVRRGRSARGGYLMIESAEIQNFRAFKQTTLAGLKRVNVIVGDNGAGKTALLEALFTAVAGTPEILPRFRGWRGADAGSLGGTAQEIYDGIFLDFFHNFRKDLVSAITLTGNANDSQSIRFHYKSPEPTVLPFGDAAPGFSGYNPIEFDTVTPAGALKFSPSITPQGLVFPPSPPRNLDPSFIAARSPFQTSQNARWFSDYSKRGSESRFIDALKAQFPYIQSLTVEVDLGAPVLFVKTPWLTSKMPIYLASDGLNKLVTLLLHLAHSEGTAVFVDEIENGFHHSRHEKIWLQLLEFAEAYETQLFMSTHSWEFLQAGAKLIETRPDDFSLVQVYQEDGVSDAIVVGGRNAGAAIASDFEVRLGRIGKKRNEL